MKMVKKILLGLAAGALVLGFAGCKMDAGQGDTDGTKWDLTMTVDGTENAKKKMADDAKYRRYWEEFSGNEACAEIETTITVDTTNSVMDTGVATAGLIFNLNKSEDGEKVEFILVGLSTAGYYVERYYDIPKGKAASLDTTESSLGSYESLDGKTGNYHNWNAQPPVDDDGNYVFKVKVEQATPKVYTVYINDTKVSVDEKMAGITPLKTAQIKKTGSTEKVEYAVGGVACYGSVAKGNKLVVKYHTEKDAVTGRLEAEEIEE